MEYNFFIPVVPVTKKNSQQIRTNRRTGSRFIAQSDQYKQFEQDCMMVIPWRYRQMHIDKPCTVTTVFYVKTHRKVDLTNLLSSIHDVLVKSGVLVDDNCSIVASVDGSRVQYRPERPGIEVTIREEGK